MNLYVIVCVSISKWSISTFLRSADILLYIQFGLSQKTSAITSNYAVLICFRWLLSNGDVPNFGE